MKKRIIITAVFLGIISGPCLALTLGEFYKLEDREKYSYLGGVYDSNVIINEGNGKRRSCLERMGFDGFTTLLSKFVVSLPADPSSKERRVFDGMNVALISTLEIDKACSK